MLIDIYCFDFPYTRMMTMTAIKNWPTVMNFAFFRKKCVKAKIIE